MKIRYYFISLILLTVTSCDNKTITKQPYKIPTADSALNSLVVKNRSRFKTDSLRIDSTNIKRYKYSDSADTIFTIKDAIDRNYAILNRSNQVTTAIYYRPIIFKDISLNFYDDRISEGDTIISLMYDKSIVYDYCYTNIDTSRNRNLYMDWIQYNSYVYFNACYFDENITFGNCIFNEKIDLYVHSNKNITFSRCILSKGINFNKELKENFKTIRLDYAKISGDFRDFGVRRFNEKKINNNIIFANSILKGNFDFSGYDLTHGNLIFNNVSLPDSINLSFIQLSGPVDFSSASCVTNGDHCYINLTGLDISKININYDLFRLYFSPNASYDEKCRIYESLLGNFKTSGKKNSYENLDVEYQSFKDSTDNKRWLPVLQKWWWNYSYEKESVFKHSLFFLMLFTFITFFFINFLNQNAYEIKELGKKIPGLFINLDTENEVAIDAKPVKLVSKNYIVIIVSVIGLFCLSLLFTRTSIGSDIFITIINGTDFLENHQIFLFSTLVALLIVLCVINYFQKKNSFNQLISESAERLWFSFIYTSNLFFPVFLKYENIKYKHKLATVYVMVVYTFGLLCIGYIANFIIAK